VDRLWAAAAGRSVDALLANAGHGLGRAFLDQDFGDVRHVIDTNVTGTVYLVQLVGRTMRSRGEGPILLTGSITVTCLMPGATETDFFERADMLDTKVGQGKKDDPADVTRVGFDAMMRGDGDVVSGWQNKLQAAIANTRRRASSPSNTARWRNLAEPITDECSATPDGARSHFKAALAARPAEHQGRALEFSYESALLAR
jgi:short-subunit dehydrogenase